MPMESLVAYECRHCKKPLNWSSPGDDRERWSKGEGQPFPLGVKWLPKEQAYNFALYSAHARSVELVFFKDSLYDHPAFVYPFDPLRNKSGSVWHCRIPAIEANDAKFYAYRVSGLDDPSEKPQRTSDPEKLLLDPYARSVFFPPGFDRSAAQRPGPNMGKAPLSLLDECQCAFDWNSDVHVRHEADLVIYEMHVRGFTRHENSGLPAHQRGTFEGVIAKVPHLVELGITAVELMPVFQFDPLEDNYWGYMPLDFFAPHHAYSVSPDHCTQRSDFRRMVRSLHQVGIEVILDVVFNHTSEGNANGPTYSFKGIDNTTYYLMSDSPDDPYLNFSGCGNTLRTASPAVRQLIVDSLRYWATEMHVDGFRFDLASVFTRNSDGSVNLEDPPIFAEIAGDPALADVRLIAEPWDAGGTFLLGRRFPGTFWMQWNALYRDTLQQFVRGDRGLVGELMTRLYGSSDLFPDDHLRACHPYQSVNYVTSHDGFTLYDLVSYNSRHNEANGHSNTDGTNDFSQNCGVEGDGNVSSDVIRMRKQRAKTFACLLMLSNGTPMLRMGDEFLQTQGGNNNPYNQDNETSWLDWRRLDEHQDVFRFFKEIIAFRKSHPSISRSHFWRDDVQWFGPDGSVDLSPSSQTLAFYLRGRSVNDHDLYVLINGSNDLMTFRIQRGEPGMWRKCVDTAADSPHDISRGGHLEAAIMDTVDLAPQSVVVFCQHQTS